METQQFRMVKAFLWSPKSFSVLSGPTPTQGLEHPTVASLVSELGHWTAYFGHRRGVKNDPTASKIIKILDDLGGQICFRKAWNDQWLRTHGVPEASTMWVAGGCLLFFHGVSRDHWDTQKLLLGCCLQGAVNTNCPRKQNTCWTGLKLWASVLPFLSPGFMVWRCPSSATPPRLPLRLIQLVGCGSNSLRNLGESLEDSFLDL